jgi:hypothetical protein
MVMRWRITNRGMVAMRLILGLSAIALLLVGCSGNVYRTVKLDPDGTGPGTSIVTDARQRLISNIQIGGASRPGQVDPVRIICVEPSPDVAVAVASALGVGISASQYGSGSLSSANAEGLAQIAERTTAIQAVLRQGYQACIDYMNGAINGTTYSLRQSRLDDLLVTLVLAEDAAGAFGRRGASINTNSAASAEAAASILPQVGKGLDEATNDLSKKQTTLDEKEAALKAADEKQKANQDDASKQEFADAQRERDEAKAARDAALRSVTGLTEAASKATAGATALGQGGITAEPDPEIARAIGDMQEAFVNKDVEQAYISTCLIELGQWKQRDPEDDELRRQALEKVGQSGFADAQLNDYYLATQLGQRTWLTDHCKDNFDTFLRRAQENRYNLNVMKLQIEAQKVKLDQLNAKPASLAIGESTNARLERNAALAAHATVTEALKTLNATEVPKPAGNASVDRIELLQDLERRKAAAAQAGVQGEAQFQGLPLENEVVEVENKRNALAGDLRQHGSEAEQALWEDDFDVVQRRASNLANEYRAYSQGAASLNADIVRILKEIQQAANPSA